MKKTKKKWGKENKEIERFIAKRGFQKLKRNRGNISKEHQRFFQQNGAQVVVHEKSIITQIFRIFNSSDIVTFPNRTIKMVLIPTTVRMTSLCSRCFGLSCQRIFKKPMQKEKPQ